MISNDELIINMKSEMKANSLQNYLTRLNKIDSISGNQGYFYIMTNPKTVYKKLKDRFNSENATRANYITAIAKLFSSNEKMIKKYKKKYDIWKEYLKSERNDEMLRYDENKPTDKQKKNLVDYKDVENKYKELRKNKKNFINNHTDNLQFLLLSILINIRPKRADLGNVHLYKKEPKTNDINYIILNGTPKLIMNVYKMMHKRGTIIEDINPELQEDILDSLEAYPRKYLFVGQDGLPYENNYGYALFVRRMFKKIFGKETGVSLWRHIYVTEKINPLIMNQGQLKNEARLMGHTVGQQQAVYIWKENNEVCETKCYKK
jgi:hypothetical protein